MKILEICNFSSGIDGVFFRVREESQRLSKKGHEVRIFSSDMIKGKEGKTIAEDKLGKVKINRFPAKKLGGESFMKWDFDLAEKEALDFKPDVIISHSYRHSHTDLALKIAKEINVRAYLVTHAPFERNNSRSFAGRIAVAFYDNFIGPKILKRFDKIIAITNWEIKYLKRLGLSENNISIIPNGIPEEFFDLGKQVNEERKILFLGRVARIKNLEIVIRAISLLENKEIIFEIVGSAERNYLNELKELVNNLGLKKRIIFSPPIFNVKEKIKKIDSAEIFTLPSKSEGMPQALVEAMARGKIVLVSNNSGNMDLVNDQENGFIFKMNDSAECARAISRIIKINRNEKVRIGWNARKRVQDFSWDRIIRKIEDLIMDN